MSLLESVRTCLIIKSSSVFLFLQDFTVVDWFFAKNLLSFASFISGRRLPSSVDSCLLGSYEFIAARVLQMSRVQIRALLMISLEHYRASGPKERVHVVVLLGRVIIHVVHPSLPCRCNLFSLGREPVSIV